MHCNTRCYYDIVGLYKLSNVNIAGLPEWPTKSSSHYQIMDSEDKVNKCFMSWPFDHYLYTRFLGYGGTIRIQSHHFQLFSLQLFLSTTSIHWLFISRHICLTTSITHNGSQPRYLFINYIKIIDQFDLSICTYNDNQFQWLLLYTIKYNRNIVRSIHQQIKYRFISTQK